MKLARSILFVFFFCFLCSFVYSQKSASHQVIIQVRRTHQFSVSTQRAGNKVQPDLDNASNFLFKLKIDNNPRDNVSISFCENESDSQNVHDDFDVINRGDSQMNSISLDEIVETYKNHHIPFTEHPLHIKTTVFTMMDR